MKIYGVTGWKNSGKTGLMERLVADMTDRGLSVSTIKHAHHSFDVDHPGKDSHRHRVAGAQEVLLASSLRFVLMHEIGDGQEPSLDELMTKLEPVDILLIEGYKANSHPKIEVHRSQTGQPLIALNDSTIRAVASNADITLDRPVFDLDDTRSISEFILAEVGF
jgi:molybdopterin-guanine dinucleotide biosynthesis protein B